MFCGCSRIEERYPYEDELVRLHGVLVHDGDTVHAHVDRRGVRQRWGFRLFGLDAPELSTLAGQLLRTHVKTLLEGQKVYATVHGHDKVMLRMFARSRQTFS